MNKKVENINRMMSFTKAPLEDLIETLSNFIFEENGGFNELPKSQQLGVYSIFNNAKILHQSIEIYKSYTE